MPTIISKSPPHAAKAEAKLAAGLRGQFLAHFELIEPIGVGGMAAVIRARDTQLDRIVALKVLPPEMATDPEHVRRFQQEARSAAKLDHENIARVFYCGQDQGLLFIAFEFVEGDNLRTILEKRKALPVSEAIHFILQIATGLAHAAHRGVVHRDIKPSNIIVSASGRAKLVDMGLARSLGPQPEGDLTQSGVTLGTFDYISPEQALEPRDADVRSDIYSLGCTFYHMLTGQSPVPEGTAARKLHHHQHVAPVDPRQLNPAIPDDAAAVLGRMMAKDPRERYQQPEHLVQHLLMLAQKVGAPASNPEGVLFVDAPLPSPPQMRPAFLMAAAVILLVAFVVFLGPGQGPNGPARPQGPRAGKGSGETSSASLEVGTAAKAAVPTVPDRTPEAAPAIGAPREAAWFTPENAKDLADYLEKAETARVLITRDLDLEGVPLVFHGRSLEIKAAGTDSKKLPELRMAYPLRSGATRWAALIVHGDGTVKLTGLRFHVNATQAPEIQMAAVAHEGTGLMTLTGCEFVQLNPPEPGGRGRLTSVEVRGGRGSAEMPRLVLDHCYFAQGQEAITMTGAAQLVALHCAFAPHTTALFHLRGRSQQESELKLKHCTAMLTHGAAFLLADGPDCKLDVDDSLFSQLETPAASTATLILQAGPLARGFDYRGNGNGYHNLKTYWARRAEGMQPISTLKQFNNEPQVEERERSAELTDSPWEAREPLALLGSDEPQQAFRLRTEDPALRRGDERTLMVGVNHWTNSPLYATALRPLQDKKPEATAHRRVVNPSDPGNGIYATLEEAVASARSGDEIRIKTNAQLRIDPIQLVKPNFVLTIQAEPKYQPTLLLNPSRKKDESLFRKDESLFRVEDGCLTLKGLTIHLEPAQADQKYQSIVTLIGSSQCILRDCLLTLGGEDPHGPRLAVVTLADPGAAMRMESKSPRTHPAVEIEKCFVRGAGDLLAVRASRPFALEVTNSLLALRHGALLAVEGSSELPAGQTAEQKVELNQVTAYVGSHLVTLKSARTTRGLVKTDINTSDCLLVSATGKSMIHLEGMERNDEVGTILAWHVDRARPNIYSGFSPLLDQTPRGDEADMLLPFKKDRWLSFTQEPLEAQEARFRRVPVPVALTLDGSWNRLTIAAFRPKPEELLRCGADLELLTELLEKNRPGTAAGSDE